MTDTTTIHKTLRNRTRVLLTTLLCHARLPFPSSRTYIARLSSFVSLIQAARHDKAR